MQDALILAPIPIVAGIVEAIKTAGLPSKFASLVSIVTGVAIGYLFGKEPLFGIMYGLAASGLYSGVKSTKEALVP